LAGGIQNKQSYFFRPCGSSEKKARRGWCFFHQPHEKLCVALLKEKDEMIALLEKMLNKK